MISKIKHFFGFGKIVKRHESRSDKAKEKFADSLFKISNNLFIAAMVWIATPFLLRFNRLIENLEKYKDLEFWQQLFFLFVDYTARHSFLAYILLLLIFIGLVVMGVSLRTQAMDILDNIDRKNKRMKR